MSTVWVLRKMEGSTRLRETRQWDYQGGERPGRWMNRARSDAARHGALSSWPATQLLQGVWRRQHLRAWVGAQVLQGVRRQRYLRARPAAQRMQGVRRRQHLRAREGAQRMPGVWRR